MPFDIWEYADKGMIVLQVILIAAGFALLHRLGRHLIDTLMRPGRLPGTWDERRVQTLRGLARSILKYSIYFFAALMILEALGVRTTSILAGAGILGLAVGFGAQNLVRDILSGFFILFEDQYTVGDYVSVAGVTGTVEEIGLRVTRVREWTGELHIIPNGKIEQVTNHSRGGMGVLLDIGVAYEVDLDRAMAVIDGVCREMAGEQPELVLEEPRVLGVTELGDSGVTVQVFGKVKPMQQWSYARELRKRIKDALDAAGIEIPYPHRVVLSKQRKEGEENGPDAV